MRTMVKYIFITLVTIFVVIMTYNDKSFPSVINTTYLIWNITALIAYCYTKFKHKYTNIPHKMLMSITSLVYFPDFSFPHSIILMNFGLFLLLSFSNKNK